MNKINYLLGVDLPEEISKKLEASNLLPDIHPSCLSTCCQKDAFYADGSPKEYIPDVIYPFYAAWYLGLPIPQQHLDITPGYSHCAAHAAVDWLYKVFPNAFCDLRHINGEAFAMPVDGKTYQFCFPTMILQFCENGITEEIAVVPYPDTRDNIDDWEDGITPFYAEVQARFTLWCWRQSMLLGRRTSYPSKALIVCITGNTASETQASSDVRVRTIECNPQKDDALVSRICRAWNQTSLANTDPRQNVKQRAHATWFQRKEAEQAAAFHLDDEDFHAVVAQYMQYRSTRKSLEDQEEALKEEMDTIAVYLASLTAPDAEKGTLRTANYAYSVRHIPKRYQPARVTADLVAQYYPELLDCIEHRSTEEGRLTIETL